jgi:hypothetical protein
MAKEAQPALVKRYLLQERGARESGRSILASPIAVAVKKSDIRLFGSATIRAAFTQPTVGAFSTKNALALEAFYEPVT